jgi:hypothetical protein
MNMNRREHQRDEEKRQTDDEKRAKYVKINWKSIECDVKIKFIRVPASGEIAMGIYFSRGHRAKHSYGHAGGHFFA